MLFMDVLKVLADWEEGPESPTNIFGLFSGKVGKYMRLAPCPWKVFFLREDRETQIVGSNGTLYYQI